MLKRRANAAPWKAWFSGTEIAKSREELLGLLRGVPEHELEVSLTDLAEKGPAGRDSTGAAEVGSAAAASRAKKKEETKRSGPRSCGADGVLLKLYVPVSLTRSLTSRRQSRRSVCRAENDNDDQSEAEEVRLGCWSALWNRSVNSRTAL